MNNKVERKVFIAHYRGHDYEAAKKYGKIEVVTRGYIDYKKFDQLKYRISKELISLDSSPHDYVILDGVYLVSTLVCLIWLELHSRVNILSFDRLKEEYNLVTVSTTNFKEIFTQVNLELNEGANTNVGTKELTN